EKAFVANLSDYVVFDMPLRKPSAYAEQLKELSEAGDKKVVDQALVAKIRSRRIELLRHQALSSIQELQWRRWYGSNEEAQKALGEAVKLVEQAGGKPQRGDLTLLGSTGLASADFVAKLSLGKPGASSQPMAAIAGYFEHRRDGWDAADKLAKEHA